MSRLTKQNLDHIKDIFERETGAQLRPVQTPSPMRKLILLAAAVLCCCTMAAFAYPLFTPLDGDELTLAANYQGEGIIRIYVENGSDKELKFQKKTKLFSWVPNEEIEGEEGEILFENTGFSAHSSGYMTVDISRAYDIEELEKDGTNPASYYLLLTNKDFLFGHDWMCSFTFQQEQKNSQNKTEPHVTMEADSVEEIEGALQFYFADSYQDQVIAWNEANFTYMQKVDEILKRFDGEVIHPVSPTIMVTGPSTMLEPQPIILTEDAFISGEWVTVDIYSRLIGAAAHEKALAVMGNIPLRNYPEAVSSVPILYTVVYETSAVQKDFYAFVYGRLRSFEEMEACKIYEDKYYTIYDVTDDIYTDLDSYLNDLQKLRTDLDISESTQQKIRGIYEDYRKELGKRIYYSDLE